MAHESKTTSIAEEGPQSSIDELLEAINTEDFTKTHALITSGIDVNTPNSDGFTALHRAYRQKQYTVMELILQNGGKVDIESPSGASVLMRAAEEKDQTGIDLLLQYGANPNLIRTIALSEITSREVTPLSIALTNRDAITAKKMLEHEWGEIVHTGAGAPARG